MTWRFIIPAAPPASLSMNNRRRGNVWEQREATNNSFAFAVLHIKQQWQDATLTDPLEARLFIGWPRNRKGKLPDVDGLGSFTKAYLDALQAHVIEDDSQIKRVTFEHARLDPAASAIYPEGVVVIDLDVYLTPCSTISLAGVLS